MKIEDQNLGTRLRVTDIIKRANAYLAKYGVLPSILARQLIMAFERERAERYPHIETVERLRQIDPTPELLGGALIKSAFGAVFELNDDGTWNDFDSDDDRIAPEDVPLPAILLWEPK